MTHLHLMVIALRVSAIILVIRVLETLPAQYETVYLVEQAGNPTFFWVSLILPLSIQAAFAALFWFFPRFVVRTTVPNSILDETNPEYFKKLAVALIIGIGVYIVSFALADLIYHISYRSEIAKNFGMALTPFDQASFVATVAELVIGLALIVGSRAIMTLVKKVRS